MGLQSERYHAEFTPAKFTIQEFENALLKTGKRIITTQNIDGDLYWKMAYHKRQNKLDGLLTQVRAELQKKESVVK